jgi:hypothetical protein
MYSGNDSHNSTDDLAFLSLVLKRTDELDEREAAAFAGMATRCERGKPLTEGQRQWLEESAARLGVVEPARNLVSRGIVPRGDEVPTPAVLRRENLPMKPPGRK